MLVVEKILKKCCWQFTNILFISHCLRSITTFCIYGLVELYCTLAHVRILKLKFQIFTLTYVPYYVGHLVLSAWHKLRA